MIRPLTLLALAASLLAVPAAHAASVDIRWSEADAYTDLSENGATPEQTLPAFRKALTAFIEREVAEVLPPGHRLSLHIRDVDMAGETEPWRDPDHPEIRYLRDSYPPVLVFHFAIRDGDGTVLRSGETRITDLNYRFGPHILAHSVPFYYERELMRAWLRKTLGRS